MDYEKLKREIHEELWLCDIVDIVELKINSVGYIKLECSFEILTSDEVNEILAILRSETGLNDWKWVISAYGPEWMGVTFRSLNHLG